MHSKLAIREAIHELDNLGLEGSLEKNAFDAEGRVYHEEVHSTATSMEAFTQLPEISDVHEQF